MVDDEEEEDEEVDDDDFLTLFFFDDFDEFAVDSSSSAVSLSSYFKYNPSTRKCYYFIFIKKKTIDQQTKINQNKQNLLGPS